MLAHPLLGYLNDLKNRGVDLHSWSNTVKEEVKVEGYGYFSPRQIEYYIAKYDFLNDNDFFSEVDLARKTSGRITEYQVESALLHVENIAFEATEKCNMRCLYCTYGDLYSHHQGRGNKSMEIKTAKTLLQYLYDIWRNN